MDFPEDLWKIIKAYRFDYVKYWKHIFTKKVLLTKILNMERDIGNPLNPRINTFGLDVTSIEFEPKKVPYGDGHLITGRHEKWNFGWIEFTTDKKKLHLQKKWIIAYEDNL